MREGRVVSNNERKIKRIAAVYISVFFAIILFVSLYINYSSFQKQFIANELSLYSVSADRAVDKIETGLLYGKSLDKFYGLEELFREWRTENPNVVNIKVLSSDKKDTYYQMAERSSYKGLPVDSRIMREIKDSSGSICGYLNVTVNLSEGREQQKSGTVHYFVGGTLLLLAGILAILIFCTKGRFISADLRIEKKKILTFMLILLLAAQAACGSLTYMGLTVRFQEVCNNTGEAIRQIVQADIDKVIEQGVSYSQIYEFEEYAADITERAPVIESITLEGTDLHVTVSQNYIKKLLRKMLVDMFTILVTSMFIATEVVNFMILALNRRIGKITGQKTHDKQMSIRVSSFFIHVACYLPVSFIPIMMNEFTGGSASDFVLGLPVMMLFATGFVFTLTAGNWSERFGWKKVLLCGVALVAGSSLLAGFIQNAVVLVIARGLYGAAYALVYVAIREYAAVSDDREERSKGLSQVTAGLYAGLNIGAVLGAMIYESIGFLGVFSLSAVIAGIGLYVAKYYCISDSTYIKEIEVSGGASVVDILKNWDMLRLAIYIIAPLAISSVFFEYFLPVYAVKAAISTADIGRAFLVNGLAVAYVAPYIIQRISGGKHNENRKLFLFMTIMASGFFIFGTWGGVISILVASAVMGVAEGTVLVSQNMIMLDLEIAERAGAGKMLSVYAAIRKLSQTAGPQIFAGCLLLGAQFGMMIFGVGIVLCCVMYIWSGWVNRP